MSFFVAWSNMLYQGEKMVKIFLRARELGLYLVENKSTIRETAKRFGMAKSTVHYDLSARLPSIDYVLYKKVRKVLDKNFQEKSMRGGIATQNKYKKHKQ